MLKCEFCKMIVPPKGSLHLEDCFNHNAPTCLACNKIESNEIIIRYTLAPYRA